MATRRLTLPRMTMRRRDELLSYDRKNATAKLFCLAPALKAVNNAE